MSVVLYGDFSSPECYLAALRADALAAAGVAVDFRPIESRPHLSVLGERLSSEDQECLTERVTALQALLLPGEKFVWTRPGLTPKTEAAVSAYSEVYGSAVADEVRRLLFELYWRDGANIGDPNVLRAPLAGPVLRAELETDSLRRFGYAVSVARAPITAAASRRIRTWRAEWKQLGTQNVPVLRIGDATLHAVDALRRLGEEITRLGADPAPQLSDPRVYPVIKVRPSAAWVSQIGGSWRTAHQSGTGAK